MLHRSAFHGRCRAVSAARRPHVLAAGPALIALVVALPLALAACSVTLLRPQPTQTAGSISIPVRILRDRSGGTAILVAVTISGKGPYTFVLDTGAESTLIDSDLARTLALKVTGRARTITGVGGVQEAVPVQISDWHMDKLRLPTMIINSASFGDRLGNNIRGLLGSDVLSQFGAVTIDYDNSTLIVYKQLAAVPRRWNLPNAA